MCLTRKKAKTLSAYGKERRRNNHRITKAVNRRETELFLEKVDEETLDTMVVPILTAEDICKGDLGDTFKGIGNDRGSCCLLGWCSATAQAHSGGGRDTVRHTRVYGLLRYALQVEINRTNYARRNPTLNVGLPTFNDHPHRARRTVAELWNRAMASLGFTKQETAK